jgi:hypothetical protein
MLNKFEKELAPLFYEDEYETNAYRDTMYYSDYDKSFKIALPEALITDPERTAGKIALREEADGRKLFYEIEGKNFAERFEIYSELYHNSRFGETTDRLIQSILRISLNIGNGTEISGESILKNHYTEKHSQLLKELSENKHSASLPEEKRLYSIFFNILKDEYATVNDFKK